jgi:hypothetical protein
MNFFKALSINLLEDAYEDQNSGPRIRATINRERNLQFVTVVFNRYNVTREEAA